MEELINRLKRYSEHCIADKLDPDFAAAIVEAINVLSLCQMLGAKSEQHGKWLWEYADNGWADHICSVCGYTKNTDIHVVMDYNFCPNCGARMDGG